MTPALRDWFNRIEGLVGPRRVKEGKELVKISEEIAVEKGKA